jgi:hypothetical protein
MVDAFSNNFSNFISELNNISSKGRFDVAPKLKPVTPQTLNLSTPQLPGIGNANGGGATGNLLKLMNAIRSQESGNNYRAINKDSGALGGYQIMPFNLFGGSEWDRKALGRDVSRSEFLNNPAIQDAIAKWQLGNYLRKYGAAGAAVAWYGGPGAVKNMYSKTTQTGGYPSLYAYWTSVLSKM